MTIREALAFKHEETPLLLTTAIGKTKEFLYLHPDKKLSIFQEKKYKQLLTDRNKGIPFAYLVGKKAFYGRDFFVTRQVLIPRPETETLIDIAKNIIMRNNIGSVLDVGTGSGCIGITLKKEVPGLMVSASDISTKALDLAKKNSCLHKTKIQFYKSNILKNIPGTFELIIANLPYVPKTVYKKNIRQLIPEPKQALVDKPGWPLTKTLIAQAERKIKPGGILILEHDPSAMRVLKTYGKDHMPTIFKDLTGKDRFIAFQY